MTPVERLVVVRCPSLVDEHERGDELRTFARVLEVIEQLCPWVEPARLGICTLPARGPSRFFGGERAFTDRLTRAIAGVLTPGEEVTVGVADGLFAGMLAAGSGVIVPPGRTAGFVAPWSVAVLQRPELAATLARLGVRTLGQFADLPVRHVLARFGADAHCCHRVARGEEGELDGLRDPAVARRLRQLTEVAADGPRQPGFFGGTSAADLRAVRSFIQVQQRLGPDAVQVGRLDGGRGPEDRGRLVPWGSRDGRRAQAAAAAPWPGRIPPPSPVTVVTSPVPAELADPAGRPLRVDGRGLLTAEPSALSVAGRPLQPVTAWAGPWPTTERWWSARRRRARLQVVTAAGASLLAVEGQRWWLEAVYD